MIDFNKCKSIFFKKIINIFFSLIKGSLVKNVPFFKLGSDAPGLPSANTSPKNGPFFKPGNDAPGAAFGKHLTKNTAHGVFPEAKAAFCVDETLVWDTPADPVDWCHHLN